MRSEPGFPCRARPRAWLPLLLAAVAALVGCVQADTLGNEPPDTVQIVGAPSWDNGISALLGLKCVVCHNQPRPEISPRNTPADLNLTQRFSSGTMRGAEDIFAQVLAGNLRQDVLIFLRMPPRQATPLSEGERTALETWAGSVQQPDVGGGTTADGAVLFTRNCQGCHGPYGLGRLGPDIQGANSATIGVAIATGKTMRGWPTLSLLGPAQVQAIANFLGQFP